MTIHSEHPFATPEGERDALRRFRARRVSPVTVWAAGDGQSRAGLTVSSILVADGDPAHLLGLVDEDSTFADALPRTELFTVSVLTARHQRVAEVFAGLEPSPGGMFRTGDWTATPWGPRLTDASAWVGCRLVWPEPPHAGWALLVDGTVEHVELADDDPAPLGRRRGRYLEL